MNKEKYKVYFKFDDDKEIEFGSVFDDKFEINIQATPNYTSFIEFEKDGKKFKLMVSTDSQLKQDLRTQKLNKILNK